MKMSTMQEEWYPIYSLEEVDSTINDEDTIEISEDLINRYNKCLFEFREIQKELHEEYNIQIQMPNLAKLNLTIGSITQD